MLTRLKTRRIAATLVMTLGRAPKVSLTMLSYHRVKIAETAQRVFCLRVQRIEFCVGNHRSVAKQVGPADTDTWNGNFTRFATAS